MRRIGWPLLHACFAISLATPDLHAHPGAGIVVDRAGNVFFVKWGHHVILRRSPDGTVTTFVDDPRLRAPHHLVAGADGSLFVTSDHDGIVWRVNADASLVEHLQSKQIAHDTKMRTLHVGAWGDPFTVDAAGNVYALARPGGPAVVRLGANGVVTPLPTRPGMGDMHFSGMAIGPDGALYLSDEGRVWRLTDTSVAAVVSSGLSRAVGIALDANGSIYVADYDADRVVRFGPDGKVNTPAAFGRLRLGNPTGVALGGSDLYVLDAPPGTIAIWRVSGQSVERLYLQRDSRVYRRWAMMSLPVILIGLLVLRAFQKRRTGAKVAQSLP